MDTDATSRFVPEHRRTNFKNRGRFGAEELRKRREEAQIEIRKAKRDEQLAKRRNIPAGAEGGLSDSEDDYDEDNQNLESQVSL
jgi:hypothetical protein